MLIYLRYFGVRTPSLGSTIEIEVPAGTNIEGLVDKVAELVEDSKEELLQKGSFLVNKIGVKKDTVLKDGDEVFVLFTIGGG